MDQVATNIRPACKRRQETAAEPLKQTLGIKNEALCWDHPHLCCTFVRVLLQNRCHSHDQSWWNGIRSARLEREFGGELSEICTRQLQDHRGSRLQSAENPNVSEQRSASSQSTWEPSQHRAQRCQFRLEPEHRHHQKGHHEVHGGKSVPAMLGGVGLLGWQGECKLLMTTDSPSLIHCCLVRM